MDLITLAKRGTCMKCSENFYISLCEHRNILIDKQNTCEQNPFMNYCMKFHDNTYVCKHMFQQHRLLTWLKYAVGCFSINVRKLPRVCVCVCVCVCVWCPFIQFRYRSSTVVCKEMQLRFLD